MNFQSQVFLPFSLSRRPFNCETAWQQTKKKRNSGGNSKFLWANHKFRHREYNRGNMLCELILSWQPPARRAKSIDCFIHFFLLPLFLGRSGDEHKYHVIFTAKSGGYTAIHSLAYYVSELKLFSLHRTHYRASARCHFCSVAPQTHTHISNAHW